jgi:hypothetical protein
MNNSKNANGGTEDLTFNRLMKTFFLEEDISHLDKIIHYSKSVYYEC